MESEKTVYRAADGSLAYDGLPWSELSDEDRTKRIAECYVLKYATYKSIAKILKVLTLEGEGNGDAIRSHLKRFRIEPPKVVSKPPLTSSRRNATSFSGSKLSGDMQQERIRRQTEYGQAIVAQEDKKPVPHMSYWEKLKRQAGFCVAILGNGAYRGEYCGEDTGNPDIHFCKGHRPDSRGRSKPDLRGRIWMNLPAS